MEEYKKQFTDFMLSCNALKFGDFTLKSGRRSPFFMNAGAYVEGGQLHDIACYYAKARATILISLTAFLKRLLLIANLSTGISVRSTRTGR